MAATWRTFPEWPYPKREKPKGAEQYQGFAALPPGGPDPARGRQLVAAAGGSVTEALKRHHPDHGGKAEDFADVQAYRAQAGS